MDKKKKRCKTFASAFQENSPITAFDLERLEDLGEMLLQ